MGSNSVTSAHTRDSKPLPHPKARLGRLLPLLLSLALVGLSTPALSASCPDNDNDGYAVCSGGCDPSGKDCGDCNDGNAGINPGALERCNGVDDNCDGKIDGTDPTFPKFDPVEADGTPVDDDGDGDADEGYGFCVFNESAGPEGVCKTGGILVCKAPPGPVTYEAPAGDDPHGLLGRGVFTCENTPSAIIEYAEESLAAGNCFDGVDNDCDGKMDVLEELACQEPEKCDGLDNDGDGVIDNGFGVGTICTVGIGSCQRNGIRFCNAAGNGTECSAEPGAPKQEGTIHGLSCANGVDDDCDGLVDLADPDCAGFGQPELCGNGIDDDGDGVTDEGFSTLGLECATGVGACRQIGAFQCTADRLDTECGAVALDPPEPGVELSCNDFIDNDCDGFTDAEDVDCAGAFADLGVTCSLPYRVGRRPADCLATHYIELDGGQATEVKADLVSVDANGELLAIIEDVKDGDIAYLGSRVNSRFWRVTSSPTGDYHTMFHKNPMLRVTGKKGSLEDVAYCGIVPFVQVTTPRDQTLSLPDDDSVELTAYLPLVDVDTLKIELNGIDILDGIGIDPGSQLPTLGGALCTTPGECRFQIQAGCGVNTTVDVDVERLVIEALDQSIAPDTNTAIAVPHQTNSLQLRLSGLPPGGHLLRISGKPLPRAPLNLNCYRDDLTDRGKASAFAITVDSPADQEIVLTAPVNVTGTVCAGKEISSLAVNGQTLDVQIPDHQTCSGDDQTTPQECIVKFDELLPEHTFADATGGTAPLGSFLRGSNQVIVDATASDGSRTFNTDVVFALGAVQKPLDAAFSQVLAASESTRGALLRPDDELDASVLDQLRAEMPTRLQRLIDDDLSPQLRDVLWNLDGYLRAEIAEAMDAASVDGAFLVGLEKTAAQDFFDTTCVKAVETFTADLSANLSGKTFGTFDIQPDCSCDLNDIPLVLRELSFTTWASEHPSGDPPTCQVDFIDGALELSVRLPKVNLKVGSKRSCTTRGLFGECIARTKVDVEAAVNVADIRFDVTISEQQIETKTPDKNAFEFSYDVRDPDGTPLYAQAGACSNPSGLECLNDSACWPLTSGGAGKCAKGPAEGAGCMIDANCPPDGSELGLGNKCSGGENQGKSCKTSTDCPGGACYAKCVGTCNGVVKNDKDSGFDPVTKQDVGIECWGASICLVLDTVARAIGGAFAFVFTGGDFDVGQFIFQQFGVGGFEFEQAFLSDLQLGEPDAMGLNDAGVNPAAFAQDSKSSLFKPGPINAEITPDGLLVSVGAEFESTCEELAVDETPGAALTPARLPTAAEVAAVGADISVLVADDVFNQIFSSMTQCGDLQAFCTSAGEDLDTVGDLLPVDCSTLPLPGLRGQCNAIRGVDCSTLGNSIERGVCHGFKGEDCLTLPLNDLSLVERQRVKSNCQQTVARDINQDDSILLCGQVDMDPEIGIKDEDANDKFVGVDLAMKQVSVVFVLDRSQDSYTNDLAELKGCFSTQGNAAPDCQLFATCLDLAISTDMGIDNSICAANELGFVPKVKGVIPSNTSFGVMCNVSGTSDDQSILAQAFESVIIDKIAENAERFAPPMCIEGLSLKGVIDIDFNEAKLFGITTDGITPGYADYLGVTVGLGLGP